MSLEHFIWTIAFGWLIGSAAFVLFLLLLFIQTGKPQYWWYRPTFFIATAIVSMGLITMGWVLYVQGLQEYFVPVVGVIAATLAFSFSSYALKKGKATRASTGAAE